MQETSNIRPRRSFLFVPGTGPEMFPKAIQAAPDIVCVDLEDAVIPEDKPAARAATLPLFEGVDASTGPELLVRINSIRSRDGLEDISAILAAPAPPPGLMVPKVKTPDEIQLLDDLLDSEQFAIRLQVIIETNEGLEACVEIASASARIDSLLFGGVDMAAELRVEPTWDALLFARMRVVHAAASAGVDLIDVPFLDLNDMDGLDTEARLCSELGFTGKGAIHPKQLPIITKHFTPSAEQIERAKRITRAFEEARTGLVVVDGKLIENPVLRSMYRILSIAENTGAA